MARYRAREASYLADKLYEAGEVADIPDDLDVDVGENWEPVDEHGHSLAPKKEPPAATRHRPIQPAPSSVAATPLPTERHPAAPPPPNVKNDR